MKLRLKPWISNLPDYIAGRTIEEIKARYNLSQVHKMASNENIFGPCRQVREYLKNNLNDLNYYPDSDALGVRLAIAKKYKTSHKSIIMGNGTDQIIEMICDCFIDRGDNIVTADPNFLIYEKAALKCGGDVIKVNLDKKSFKQDPEGIVNSVNKKTKIIFLASPHNPTGTIITENQFDYIVKNTGPGVLVVLDEAYYEYLEEEYKIDTLEFIKNNSNIISLRTFSKIYGLAGLRIGYAIAGDEVICALNKIRLPFNTSLLAQKAALKAIENDWYADEIREGILNEKKKFYEAFDSLKIDYIKSHANFILLKTGKKSREIIEKLLESGFIVRPGQNLGFASHIRVTISTPDINEKFLEKFTEIYSFLYNRV